MSREIATVYGPKFTQLLNIAYVREPYSYRKSFPLSASRFVPKIFASKLQCRCKTSTRK